MTRPLMLEQLRAPSESRLRRRGLLVVALSYLIMSGLSLGIFVVWFGFSWILYRILEARIMGDCARLGPQQLPDVHLLLDDACREMQMPAPDLYITDEEDPLPIYTVDLKRPTIVLHTDYARKLKPLELKFLLCHELGHIQAGHLRLLSLLNVLEAHPPISRFLTTPLELARWVMRPWALRADETADRIALASLEGDIDTAAAALAKVAAGVEIGDRINPVAFREQAGQFRGGWMIWINEFLYNRNLLARRLNLLETFEPRLLKLFEETKNPPPGRLERLRRLLLPLPQPS